MNNDLEIFMDMMDDIETPFVEVVETGKNNSYYEGLGIHILKQFENNDHYFYFLKSILKNYHELSKDQQNKICELMNIQPNVIIQKKTITVEKKKKNKNQKPKLNMKDEY